ncbi:MAG: hypothetical protein PHN26_03955 [Eubacteriaceae bacterium]|nr:hypothetical protein [Eubacteriaceae bacterium]
MSQFSQMLGQWIEEKAIRVSEMAAYCQYDRATLYRIIKGERKPVDKNQVSQFARYLCLTPTQREKLFCAYYEVINGPECHAAHQAVGAFLQNFSRAMAISPYPVRFSAAVTGHFKDQDYQTLNTGEAIGDALFYTLSQEVRRGGGHVTLVVQPGCEGVYPVLDLFSGEACLDIEHIISLDRWDFEEKHAFYNSACVERCLSMMIRFKHYEAKYYMARTASKFDDAALYPYFIVTEDTLISFDAGGQSGFCSHDRGALALFHQRINRLHRIIRPLFSEVRGLTSQLNRSDLRKELQILNGVPAVFSLMNQEMLRTVLSERHQKNFSVLCKDVDHLREMMANRGGRCYFSREGLWAFARGKIRADMPMDFKGELTPAQRLTILKKVLTLVERDRYRVLKNDELVGDLNLLLAVTEKEMCIMCKMGKAYYIAVLKEPGLITVGRSFMMHLKDYGEVMPRDQAVTVVKNSIEALEQRI